ncbi:MAG: Mrp/NBP35 family ATP-binding protein [Dehalococcoidia bacterium]|nr:Mrp/NBP35 family ATP-binding protein [Dehalococcoidia bacterium]
MARLTEKDVYAALARVQDPELGRDLVSLNMVRDVQVRDGHVSLKMVLTTPACPLREKIEADVKQALQALPGVKSVSLEMGAEVRAAAPQKGPQPIEDVKHVIAVASNKGGVGKTTVAVNLAVALAKAGARVGLLDADVTGPNVPLMVGLRSGFMGQERGLTTVERYGVKVCSLGFVLPKASAVIWRGPLIDRAIRDLLHQLSWGELDYLLVDLPPGTSDASLSVAQSVPLSGVLIVTTPQEVSLEDATKAVTMFQRMDVPVLGIVENMSYFVCPHCGKRTAVFGEGGGRVAAEEMELEFLGEIPLDVETRAAGDEGVPVVEMAPESAAGRVFRALAERVAARCSVVYLSSGAD